MVSEKVKFSEVRIGLLFNDSKGEFIFCFGLEDSNIQLNSENIKLKTGDLLLIHNAEKKLIQLKSDEIVIAGGLTVN